MSNTSSGRRGNIVNLAEHACFSGIPERITAAEAKVNEKYRP